ncbi:MAG TPA: hypothetical protein VGM57_02600 [Pseudolabrys sp.]|jgi:hypothetical protein
MQKTAASLEASSSQTNPAAIRIGAAAAGVSSPTQFISFAIDDDLIDRANGRDAPPPDRKSRRSKTNNDNVLDVFVRERKFFNKGARQ